MKISRRRQVLAVGGVAAFAAGFSAAFSGAFSGAFAAGFSAALSDFVSAGCSAFCCAGLPPDCWPDDPLGAEPEPVCPSW